MNKFLMEKQTIKAIAPQSLDASPLVGDRVKLDKGFRLAIVVHMGGSTGAVVALSLKQHNAASAGTTKALEIANPYYHKAGAATVFTKVQPEVATDAYTLSSVFAADAGVVVLEVEAAQLDVNAGFAWVSVDVAAPTAAKIFAIQYVAHEVVNVPAYELAL